LPVLAGVVDAARRDAALDLSFGRNTLAAHAEQYPALWCGIWTGPDSFNGPDKERPGEADAHLATALTDYPPLNVHVHTGPLRGLTELVGVEGTRGGIRITPRLPTERFSVRWPRLRLSSTAEHLEGGCRLVGSGAIEIDLALPSGLRGAEVAVEGYVRDVARDPGGRVHFTVDGHAGEEATWVIRPAAPPP
jgi:hypothetical protein